MPNLNNPLAQGMKGKNLSSRGSSASEASNATHSLPQSTKTEKQAEEEAVFDFSKRSEFLEQIKQLNPSCTGNFERAMSGKSLAAGMKGKCLDCMAWERSRVRNCENGNCPLWPHRPYQDRSAADTCPELKEEREMKLNQVQSWNPSYLGHFEKAYQGKSRRSAVNAKCLDCTCCQRIEVKHCPVTQCTLWPYRPYKPLVADD